MTQIMATRQAILSTTVFGEAEVVEGGGGGGGGGLPLVVVLAVVELAVVALEVVLALDTGEPLDDTGDPLDDTGDPLDDTGDPLDDTVETVDTVVTVVAVVTPVLEPLKLKPHASREPKAHDGLPPAAFSKTAGIMLETPPAITLLDLMVVPVQTVEEEPVGTK